MTKQKRKPSPPSRRRYESRHPVMSFRSDRQLKERADRLCGELGCSYADLMKLAVDRVEEMMRQKVNELLDTRVNYMERSLEFVEDFAWQLLGTLYDHGLPAFCPRCEKKAGMEVRLVLGWGHKIRTDGEREAAPMWVCPICGWYLHIFERMDQKVGLWLTYEEAEAALKAKLRPKSNMVKNE